MSVRLTVKQRSAEGGADKPAVVMLDDDVITLGRDQVCQVVLAQQAVSRNHARISRDGSLYFVEDLGSSYGTQINGTKLPKGEKHLLRNGDVIAIAQFDVTFDRVAENSTAEGANNTQFVARKVVKDVMRGLSAGGEQPYFRIMNGPREGERIEIADAQEYIIGRDETADIIFKDDLVSRRHVKIRRDWSGTHVEDLGSRNGIKINKKRSPGKTLQDRDEVEVGGVRLLFLDPNEVRESPLVLPDPSDEEGESTTMEKDEEVAENQRAKKKSNARISKVAKKEEAEPPPPAEEPPPEDPPPAEAPPAEEDNGEPNTSQDPPPEEEPNPEEGGDENDEGGGDGLSQENSAGPGGFDLTNRSTMIGVGIGAFALLIGIVVLILLVAGA